MPELNGNNKALAGGTKVVVANPGPVPEWSEWDDDGGRTSGSLKKRLQEMFFRGERKITAEIVYVSSESEREALKRKGRVKVRLKEPSGSMLVVTADSTNLKTV